MDKSKHKSGELCSVDVLCGTGYGTPHVYTAESIKSSRIPRQTNDDTESITDVAFEALNSIDGGKLNIIKETLNKMECDIDRDMIDEKLKEKKITARYTFLGYFKNTILITKYLIITLMTIVTMATLSVGTTQLKLMFSNPVVKSTDGLAAVYPTMNTINNVSHHRDNESLHMHIPLYALPNNTWTNNGTLLNNQTDDMNFKSINIIKNNTRLLNKFQPHELVHHDPEAVYRLNEILATSALSLVNDSLKMHDYKTIVSRISNATAFKYDPLPKVELETSVKDDFKNTFNALSDFYDLTIIYLNTTLMRISQLYSTTVVVFSVKPSFKSTITNKLQFHELFYGPLSLRISYTNQTVINNRELYYDIVIHIDRKKGNDHNARVDYIYTQS
ncbi:MAG: hypothetical protein ACRYE7_02510 [Janthinobacterium lividum]